MQDYYVQQAEIEFRKIHELKEKLRNYQGGVQGYKTLEIALKKSLVTFAIALDKTPAKNIEQLHIIINAREECCELELKLGYTEDAANSMHFLSSTYFNCDRNYENLKKAYERAYRASRTNANNLHHKRWMSTVSVAYIDFLNNEINIFKHQNLLINCVPLFQEIIQVYDQQDEHGKLYHNSLRFFDLNVKLSLAINDNNIASCAETDVFQLLNYYLNMANCLVVAKKFINTAPDKQTVIDTISSKEKYLLFLLITLQGHFLDRQQDVNHLPKLELWYFRILEIFNILNLRESSAIIYAKMANQYFHSAIKNNHLKTETHLQKMYEFANKAIEMMAPQSPPRELLISEIYELYANFKGKSSPRLAVQLYEDALKYWETYCKVMRVRFFCLKGLGSCYKRFAKERDFRDERAYWNDIDADLQTAIKYFSEALSFYEQYINDPKLSKSDCLYMISVCHYELGLHYEKMFKCRPHAIDLDFVINRYKLAIQFATESEDLYLKGKSLRQLANCYYFHKIYHEAIIHWQLAIESYLEDLREKSVFPYMRDKLWEEYNIFRNTYRQNWTEEREAYNIFLENIISYARYLKNSLFKSPSTLSEFLASARQASETQLQDQDRVHTIFDRDSVSRTIA